MSHAAFEIVHNEAANRFEAHTPAGRAELVYRFRGERILFTHTGVPPALRGQGLGGQIVKAGLEYARTAGLVVEPRCPFVAAYIDEHPEYQALLDR